jgi:hypothetical protein
MFNKFKIPAAVVVIDVWTDIPGHLPHPILKNLTEFIQQDFVKCIVVASYSNWKLHNTFATPIEWPIWHNSRRIFNPNLNPAVPVYTGSAWLAQEHAPTIPNDGHSPLLNQFILHDIPVTNPAVLNMSLRSDQKMFAAWTLDQLVYLLNSQYPNVGQLYLCGGAFEQCLKDRPVGLEALMNAMGLNLFDTVQHLLIPTKCVSTSQGGLLSDELELIDPVWQHNKRRNIIHVQGRIQRDLATSKDVLAALNLEPIDEQPAVPAQIDNQQAALARARLETKKRRGLL